MLDPVQDTVSRIESASEDCAASETAADIEKCRTRSPWIPAVAPPK